MGKEKEKEFKCCSCEKVSKASEWNFYTGEEVGDHNGILPIEDIEEGSDTWYKCPNCRIRLDSYLLQEVK